MGYGTGTPTMRSPVPGFKNLKQLEENIGAVNFGPLSAEDMMEIEAVVRPAL